MTTVEFDRAANRLVIIDQTLLPGEVKILRLHTPDEIFEAIRSLRVRGAPAIGVATAVGMAVAAREFGASCRVDFERRFIECRDYLAASRPTAVNLFYALDRMTRVLSDNPDADVCCICELLCNEAIKIREEDIAMSRAIGEHGVELFRSLGMEKGRRFTVLTHCNAGSLAAVKYGTALAPVHLAKELGYDIAVVADETRPLLQGARLTAYELTEDGIDTTVICDNMVSTILGNHRENITYNKSVVTDNMVSTILGNHRENITYNKSVVTDNIKSDDTAASHVTAPSFPDMPKIDAVIVGADRIAANGDAANKIGTRGVAITAKFYSVPFIVAAPSSTVDTSLSDGSLIPIELRDGSEISELHYRKRMTPSAVHEFNPAFDVTPSSLISAVVTENGVFCYPYNFS